MQRLTQSLCQHSEPGGESVQRQKGGKISPTQCPVIFLSQEGLTLRPGGVHPALTMIAQNQKGSDSSVVGAKGAVQIVI